MKILVTGGNGFIGSAVVSRLMQRGHDVSVYDLIEGGAGARFIKGDILDADNLGRSIEGSDCVIHMVGLPDARVAQENPRLSFDLNVRGNEILFEELRKREVPRVIIPSSAAIYGVTSKVPISEDTPPNPTNVYSHHKLMAEQLASCYASNYGIDVTVLRLFNVYGPRGKGILNILVKNAQNDETTTLYGERQKRDFVHVSDIAMAFQGVLEQGDGRGNHIYNVGTGQGTSISEVVELVQEYFPHLQVRFGRFDGEEYHSVADLTRIRNSIRFKPMDSKVNLRRTVEEIMGKVPAYG